MVDGMKSGKQFRGELPVVVLLNDPTGFLVGMGLLIGPCADDRIIYICQPDYLRTERNLIALQSIGVAAAVPTFMVAAADLSRVDQYLVFIPWVQPLNDLISADGVHPHSLHLLFIQAAGETEDLVGNDDFADIMHRRCGGNLLDLTGCQSSLLFELVEQRPGDLPYSADMRAGLKVPKFNQCADGVDDGFHISLMRVNLSNGVLKFGQYLSIDCRSLFEQPDTFRDSASYDFRLKWLNQHLCRAEFHCAVEDMFL